MNPFAQLVSPEALVDAIAASVELQQLPGRAYRPLDTLHGLWSKQPLSERRDDDPPLQPQS
ncbi:hypothetical protein [Azohydromonas caseinilytica]|uniref:Uncharacterized protein n=1 Tax=Azohydromonas caseinilytica TaxID=2728836 RepID=A0A848FH11_9BURK|nr:hypothetical protein [Azohydromonas caseinilytica]NML18125.1 hypothetical protein [Azohydromonas caseinilytica]